MACTKCGCSGQHSGLRELEQTQPISLLVAAELIPMTPNALRQFLFNRKEQFPASYRLVAHARGQFHRERILTSEEIQSIRAMRTWGTKKDAAA